MPSFANVKYPDGFKKMCSSFVEDRKALEYIRFEPIGEKVYMMDYKNKILKDIKNAVKE
ncbi:MAG: hypothetical protein IJ332_01445 [Clostridia bacterium]|nr:hypothetical protein [Clostridia bacterium]